MPIEIQQASAATVSEITEDALFTSKGVLTLECETLAQFLNTVDFDSLFEDADLRQFVRTATVPVVEEDDRLIPVLAEDADANVGDDPKSITIEFLDGEIVAEAIDEDDLGAMLEFYLKNEHPDDTLEDRTAIQQFADMMEDDDDAPEGLDEKFRPPFRKGDFRKGPMQKVSAKSKGVGRKAYGQRVRMMVAMLRKGAIVRVPKGTGYKGGDYKRGPGYGGGTPAGKKAYAAASVKDARQASKIGAAVDPGRRKIVQVIYKNLGKSMPKNWVPPEKRGKMLKGGKIAYKKVTVTKDQTKKGGAVNKGKALFGGKGKGGKIDVAHTIDASHTLHEGAALAGRVIGLRKKPALTEAAK